MLAHMCIGTSACWHMYQLAHVPSLLAHVTVGNNVCRRRKGGQRGKYTKRKEPLKSCQPRNILTLGRRNALRIGAG
jgi:hypothetical protein